MHSYKHSLRVRVLSDKSVSLCLFGNFIHLWEMDCLTIIYNLKNIENKICIVYYICYHIITNITLLINNYK